MKQMFAIAIFLFACSSQSDTAQVSQAIGESAKKEFLEKVGRLSSSEYEIFLEKHRTSVRRGYTNILLDELNQDSLNGLISFFKFRLHQAFSLTQTKLITVIEQPSLILRDPIVYTFPNGKFIVLETGRIKVYGRVDKSIPIDPWEKKAK